MQIDLFIPCFIDQFYPDTAWNTVKVLEKAGCTINYNPNQTCCGQPAFNSGYWEETRDLAKKFIKDFASSHPIVSPSGSCSGFIKNNYHKVINNKDVDYTNVLRVQKNIVELSDFLVNHLNKTDFGAEFPHKVTYHDSCSALREYGIKEEPRILLKNVKGLELIEMNESETCCGFGGTFSAKYKGISSAMVQQKVENAMATGAEYITGSESSCLMNIEAYIKRNKLPIKVLHFVDIIANF